MARKITLSIRREGGRGREGGREGRKEGAEREGGREGRKGQRGREGRFRTMF